MTLPTTPSVRGRRVLRAAAPSLARPVPRPMLSITTVWGALAAWTFLTPVFDIAFGLLLTGERPAAWTAIGMLLVLASLWTVVRSPPQPAQQEWVA